MARRGQEFKMRLLDDEVADLNARAERDGLAKADVIRKAMGWPVVELVKASSPAERAASATAPPPPSPSDSSQPGVVAADELARRIERRKAREQ